MPGVLRLWQFCLSSGVWCLGGKSLEEYELCPTKTIAISREQYVLLPDGLIPSLPSTHIRFPLEYRPSILRARGMYPNLVYSRHMTDNVEFANLGLVTRNQKRNDELNRYESSKPPFPGSRAIAAPHSASNNVLCAAKLACHQPISSP